MTVGRLLLDEMLSPTIAEQLRARGHDVVAVSERSDVAQLPDEQVLAWATEERRAVVTLDIADFAALDAQWKSQRRAHAGVLYVTSAAFPQDRSFLGAVVAALDVAAQRGELPGADETRFLARRPS